MEDRTLLNNGKSSFMKATLPSTYADFVAAMAAGTQKADITPNDSLSTDPGVSAIGTALSTANILSNSTATALGLTSAATPNDAFAEIANALEVVNTVTFAVADWIYVSVADGYQATKTVSGITANSKPIPSLHYTTNDATTCKAEQKAMSRIVKFETSAGTIKATAYLAPTTAVSIDFRGI